MFFFFLRIYGLTRNVMGYLLIIILRDLTAVQNHKMDVKDYMYNIWTCQFRRIIEVTSSDTLVFISRVSRY